MSQESQVYECTGCGRLAADPEADLIDIQASGGMTCCPERHIQRRAFHAATLRQQAARVDEGYAQDLRHLIYLDTQFGWRGETDLKLPEMQALEARGWITEGGDNGEYLVTEEGERALNAVLSAPPLMFADNGDDIERRMAYDSANACPHCGGSGHKGDAAHALEAALSAQPAPERRSSHAVWRRDEWLPCYCAATADHPIGEEHTAAPVGVPDSDRIDWMEANARSVSFGKAPQQGYWVHVQGVGYSGGSNKSLRDAIDAARAAHAAEIAAAPSAPQGTQQGDR